jgi:hypothetical protein
MDGNNGMIGVVISGGNYIDKALNLINSSSLLPIDWRVITDQPESFDVCTTYVPPSNTRWRAEKTGFGMALENFSSESGPVFLVDADCHMDSEIFSLPDLLEDTLYGIPLFTAKKVHFPAYRNQSFSGNYLDSMFLCFKSVGFARRCSTIWQEQYFRLCEHGPQFKSRDTYSLQEVCAQVKSSAISGGTPTNPTTGLQHYFTVNKPLWSKQ